MHIRLLRRHASWVLAIWTLSVSMLEVVPLHILWDHHGDHHRVLIALAVQTSIDPDEDPEHSHSISQKAPILSSRRTSPPLRCLQPLGIQSSVTRLVPADGRKPPTLLSPPLERLSILLI